MVWEREREGNGYGSNPWGTNMRSMHAVVVMIPKKAGWSSAKSNAAGMLRKNPNAYFYRHNEPGEVRNRDRMEREEKLALNYLDRSSIMGTGQMQSWTFSSR